VTGRIIETDADVHEGMLALSAMCPRMKAAYALTGPLPLRRRADGFAQVLSAIVGQQVSVASGAAVWSRIEAAGFNTPAAVLAASDDELRAVRLSRQKFIYARELALADID
jgi:DNA-3-methyladenine glycosylase II